jgi:hypothetical protein
MQGIRRDPPRLGFREKLAAERRVRLILEINVPCEAERSRARNAGNGWRRRTAGALLLQVTPDLPNPAEYEADRHRD